MLAFPSWCVVVWPISNDRTSSPTHKNYYFKCVPKTIQPERMINSKKKKKAKQSAKGSGTDFSAKIGLNTWQTNFWSNRFQHRQPPEFDSVAITRYRYVLPWAQPGALLRIRHASSVVVGVSVRLPFSPWWGSRNRDGVTARSVSTRWQRPWLGAGEL